MAGRITQVFIDDLLDRVDIVDVIDRRVKLKKTGKNYSACCPFHDEKTPSFSVNPDKQFYYCFGCGAGGNAIGFIMDYDSVEFPQAVENLADHTGLTVAREERHGSAPPKQRNGLHEALEKASLYYQMQLRKHPDASRAVKYLKGRGLDGIIAKQYGIGFAPPGWDNLIASFAEVGAEISHVEKDKLLKAGLVVENDKGRTYDRFRDRIVFPIKDQRGRVIAFGGRVLGDDKPKYLNSPETEVFHKGRELYGLYEAKKATRKLDKIIVVEGYMDVIALAQHNIHNAVATLGTATSEAHLERIYRLCPEVIFCFDGDDAGRKAATRALENALPCMQDGRQARFLFLPEGEDPDTVVREKGREYFDRLVVQSKPLETFMFESLSASLDMESIDGRARLSKLSLPLIERIPEGVYRQLMLAALAKRAGLDASELMRLIAATPNIPAPPVYEAPKNQSGYSDQSQYDPLPGPPTTRTRRAVSSQARGFKNLVQQAIALLVHYPQVARIVKNTALFTEHDSDKGTDMDTHLLHKLLDLLHRRPESNTHMLMGHWHGTPEGDALNHIANQEHPLLAASVDLKSIEQQFSDILEKIQQQSEETLLDSHVDKLKTRDYAGVSDLEKLEILKNLQRKQ